tara:strand:- start:1076 stop:2047 length:972 start_codon:yes stop_codon:yes gene_type:complete
MKITDNHFENYLNKYDECDLHPKLKSVYDSFPDTLSELNNLIFYGPSGTGKYTQMLACIRKYSNTNLKYEKKLSITYNKNTYFYKISDIHFEIDMSLLGCNSKLLWNEIYNHIQDIILAKSNNIGIIVCKNFHNIHSELLDIFYSYMMTISNINLKFILLTEKISFIPDNIINICVIISVPRPLKTHYNKCTNKKLDKNINLSQISNIKHVNLNIESFFINKQQQICNNILDIILNIDNNIYIELRDKLYDIFIYNIDVTECIWYILKHLINNNHIKQEDVNDILLFSYKFFQFYNNNYRPIYHLENFIFYLINKIYGFKLCS